MKRLLLAIGLFCLGIIGSNCGNEPESTDIGGSGTVCINCNITDAGIADVTDANATDASDGNTCPSASGDNFDQAYALLDSVTYYGGPVITAPINAYIIWYGDWSKTNAPPILEDMISNVSTSDWLKIVTQYYDLTPQLVDGGTDAGQTLHHATNQISIAKSINVGYPISNNISDTDIRSEIDSLITKGTLPLDPNGIYFFFTSADVLQSSFDGAFCDQYCAYHDSYVSGSTNIKYIFSGDVTQCPYDCSLQPIYNEYGYTNSPNGDWSADGMSSLIMHEISESITDPNPIGDIAWQDQAGNEISDLCAWVYSSNLFITDNCSVANVTIGTRHYMIQENWIMDSSGGHCGLKL